MSGSTHFPLKPSCPYARHHISTLVLEVPYHSTVNYIYALEKVCNDGNIMCRDCVLLEEEKRNDTIEETSKI